MVEEDVLETVRKNKGHVVMQTCKCTDLHYNVVHVQPNVHV